MSDVVVRDAAGLKMFFCPPCGNYHGVDERWDFNEDYAKPTITPSVRVRWTFGESTETPYGAPIKKKEDYICHFFVTNGQFHYCDDCTHELRGQIVDMIPEDEV